MINACDIVMEIMMAITKTVVLGFTKNNNCLVCDDVGFMKKPFWIGVFWDTDFSLLPFTQDFSLPPETEWHL